MSDIDLNVTPQQQQQQRQANKRKHSSGSDYEDGEASNDNDGFKTPSPCKKPSQSTSNGGAEAEASGSTSREASPTKTHKKVLTPEQVAKQAEREEKKRQREAKRSEKAEKDAQKEAKKQKQLQETARAASFLSKFVRSASPIKAEVQKIPIQSDFDKVFQACLYKDIAPINRFSHLAKGKAPLEGLGENEKDTATLLAEFKGKEVNSKGAPRCRRGIHPPVSVRESMRLITEATVMGDEKLEENGKQGLANLSDRSKIPMKLLHFESNRRPAWYGTWTRTTNLIGSRKPLGQDPVALDYSYDSDAEWEDVDPNDGDDVQDNDDKEEDEGDRSDEDSEMDDWLVDDLEEEDEEEGSMPPDFDDIIPFSIKADPRLGAVASLFGKGTPVKTAGVNQLQPKKKKIKPIGRRFESKLIPFSTGPHWEDVLGESKYDGFKGFQMEFLNDAQPGLNPFTFVSAEWIQPIDIAVEAVKVDNSGDIDTSPPAKAANGTSIPSTASSVALVKAQGFPEADLPALLRAIEGSISIRPVLVEELKNKFNHLGKGATKIILDACINVYAEKLSKKQGGKWVIKMDHRGKAGLA